MAIKGQILTFREAFLLTEKGKSYQQAQEEKGVKTIEMVEMDGKWVKKVKIIFEDDNAEFSFSQFEKEFNERLIRDLENYIWEKNGWPRKG